MPITGKPGQCVNLKKSKHSYLALESDKKEITDKTDLDPDNPPADGKGRVWDGKVVRLKAPDFVRLRLTANKVVEKKKDVDEPPDGGTVTVTLINPSAKVPVEVVYVDDDHG